jgi:glycosyltransferase involved in cell wall biosynthesis
MSHPTARPLLLASNRPPEGEIWPDAPHTDFLELARMLGGDIAYPTRGGLWERIEKKTATDWRQAWGASRQRGGVSVYVSLSEKVGLPLALRGTGGVPHVLIGHYLNSPRKRVMQKRTGYLHRFDRIVVLCRTQETYLREEVGLPPEKVRLLLHHVDTRFWTPRAVEGRIEDEGTGEVRVISVGRERRDYETLKQTAILLPRIPFDIVASSPWVHRKEDGGVQSLPPNLRIQRNLPWKQLRKLYRSSAIAVVPLEAGTEYAAGATGLLEAMAMGKSVIVTGTPGISDYVEGGVTARVVPPGDPEALAAIIRELYERPVEAARLGANAQRWVHENRDTDTYLRALTEIIREVAPNAVPAADSGATSVEAAA